MSFDGEASDDEEDDNGWLAHSNFDLRQPPLTARQHDMGRRPLSSSAFDVRLILLRGQRMVTHLTCRMNLTQDHRHPRVRHTQIHSTM